MSYIYSYEYCILTILIVRPTLPTVQRHRERPDANGATHVHTERTRTGRRGGAEQNRTTAQTPTPARMGARTHPGRTRNNRPGPHTAPKQPREGPVAYLLYIHVCTSIYCCILVYTAVYSYMLMYTVHVMCAPTRVTCGMWCSGGRKGLNSRSQMYTVHVRYR